MSKRIVVGIDPGPVESAYVVWDGTDILEYGDLNNGVLLPFMAEHDGIKAIEQIRGFGILASNPLFDTCVWVGRFVQAWGEEVCELVPRKTVVTHLCGNARAGDKFVREALIARIGPQGTKKEPGPTYGIAGHKWPALAVAVAYADMKEF